MSIERDQILSRLRVALDVNQPLPRDLADWLADGLHRFRWSGSNVTLCGALGLAKTKAEQRAERNHWLCVASDCLTMNSHLPTWERAGRLAAAVAQFEQAMWPAIQDERQAPDGLRPSYKALYQAKKAINNAALPANRDYLNKLLSRRLPDSA